NGLDDLIAQASLEQRRGQGGDRHRLELVAECCVHFSNFRDNVEIVDAALAEMAVRIEGCANESASADNTAHGLEQLAFAIEAILRHHGAMQSQEHRVKRQRGGDLAEQLITQQPPGPAVDE